MCDAVAGVPWWGVMPGISTQTVVFTGKGRDSKPRRPEISTHTAEIPGKVIESNNIIKMKRRIAYDKNNRRNKKIISREKKNV